MKRRNFSASNVVNEIRCECFFLLLQVDYSINICMKSQYGIDKHEADERNILF